MFGKEYVAPIQVYLSLSICPLPIALNMLHENQVSIWNCLEAREFNKYVHKQWSTHHIILMERNVCEQHVGINK